jgi:Domain of unknown function (DUF4129)
MKVLGRSRVVVILFALMGLLAIGALASGIHDMEFREADPFYFEWPTPAGGNFQAVVQQVAALPMEQIIFFWAVVIAFAILVILLINPKYRWKILRAVIRAAIFFIVMTWALKLIAQRSSLNLLSQSATNQDTLNVLNKASLPLYTPPTENAWVTYTISLVITLGILYLGWWLWKRGARPRSRVKQNIADIARDALDQLAEGGDFGDAVTTCYIRMNDAVMDVRGMQRQEGMTPSEFASRLEASGLPGKSVQRLTRLFEEVRYGARRPGEVETKEAIACLNDIITASGAVP